MAEVIRGGRWLVGFACLGVMELATWRDGWPSDGKMGAMKVDACCRPIRFLGLPWSAAAGVDSEMGFNPSSIGHDGNLLDVHLDWASCWPKKRWMASLGGAAARDGWIVGVIVMLSWDRCWSCGGGRLQLLGRQRAACWSDAGGVGRWLPTIIWIVPCSLDGAGWVLPS
ncbi:hypothetical protein ACLOJK_015159 [Asimina triloba]